jgi:hypothetical protein
VVALSLAIKSDATSTTIDDDPQRMLSSAQTQTLATFRIRSFSQLGPGVTPATAWERGPRPVVKILVPTVAQKINWIRRTISERKIKIQNFTKPKFQFNEQNRNRSSTALPRPIERGSLLVVVWRRPTE